MKTLYKIIIVILILIQVDKINGNDFDDFDDFDDLYLDKKKQVIIYDPFEGYNRWMFELNDTIYTSVFEPVVNYYLLIVPKSVRNAISNVFKNIKYPISAINNGLQFKFYNIKTETYRFCINSTIGVLGVFDIAKSKFNIDPKYEDFGQTLGYWGIPAGPYLVLPLFGPSTIRSIVGGVGNFYLNPILSPAEKINWINQLELENHWKYLSAVDTINDVAINFNLYKMIKSTSVDFYTGLKISYMYNQKKIIQE